MPTNLLFATTSTGLAGLFSALGLDVRALLINALAFLMITAILAVFVYPSLTGALDKKRSDIEAVTKVKREAEEALNQAKITATEIITKAHHSADELLGTAQTEARNTIEAAAARAASEAKQIVDEAHEQLEHDVATARHALVGETARLVARASEHLANAQLDVARDAKLIEQSLKAARR